MSRRLRDTRMALLSRRYRRISPHDHGNAVGRKAHRLVDIEVVNGLDEADTAHLEQVVHVLAPAGKSLKHRQHQPQVAPDELFPGGHVSLLGPPQKLRHFVVFQNLQLGGVDAADLHFSLHSTTASVTWIKTVFPGKSSLYGATESHQLSLNKPSKKIFGFFEKKTCIFWETVVL